MNKNANIVFFDDKLFNAVFMFHLKLGSVDLYFFNVQYKKRVHTHVVFLATVSCTDGIVNSSCIFIEMILFHIQSPPCSIQNKNKTLASVSLKFETCVRNNDISKLIHEVAGVENKSLFLMKTEMKWSNMLFS